MEAIRTISTIDARGNIFLESMAEVMKLDNETVYDEIRNMFDDLLNELKKIRVNYIFKKLSYAAKAENSIYLR